MKESFSGLFFTLFPSPSKFLYSRRRNRYNDPISILKETTVLNPAQNQIIYLMFLNGLLFLGLNFVANAIVFPGGPGSKKLGYLLFTIVGLVLCITQEMDILIEMKFPASSASTVLLVGLAAPVFLISLVYYRVKRSRLERSTQLPSTGDSNADH